METDMRYGGHKVLVALAVATAWLALAAPVSAQQMAADPVAWLQCLFLWLVIISLQGKTELKL